ncbi:MAG: hypothetical protein A2139_11025 [Desulfobacca sp. RBG_16_60_12]|nr:MAG: hypothetical protein A2139_11025 [Desulfobacca sp. RBG_16_60_12]
MQKSKGGRKRKYPYCQIPNAITCVLRSGCAWHILAHDLARSRRPRHFFWLRKEDGRWECASAALGIKLGVAEGREPEHSAAIPDGRSVGTAEKPGEQRDDVGEKVNGRGRHVLVHTMGLVLRAAVTVANLLD